MAEEFSITNWLQEAKEDPKKVLPILVIIGTVGFLDWKYLYSPKALLVVKENKKIVQKEKEIKSFRNASSQIEDIKLDIFEKKEQLNKSLELCYKDKDRNYFLKRVRDIANKSKIIVKSINPLPIENTKIGVIDAKKLSVQFSYTGDLTKLITFMRLIELEQKITFMPIPDLIPNSDGNFDIKITVSTILLPDEIFSSNTANDENEDYEE